MRTVTHEDVVSIAKRVTTDVDWQQIDLTKNLSEQGVDSLDMMNIIFAFQEEFVIAISDESISMGEWRSVERMVESLNKAL
jgi:acyl carrier protein